MRDHMSRFTRAQHMAHYPEMLRTHARRAWAGQAIDIPDKTLGIDPWAVEAPLSRQDIRPGRRSPTVPAFALLQEGYEGIPGRGPLVREDMFPRTFDVGPALADVEAL